MSCQPHLSHPVVHAMSIIYLSYLRKLEASLSCGLTVKVILVKYANIIIKCNRYIISPPLL